MTNELEAKRRVKQMANERKTIRKHIDNFLRVLGLYAKYTVSFTKYEAWSVKIREFDGSYGQRLLLEARLAIKLSEDKVHNVTVHWGEEV